MIYLNPAGALQIVTPKISTKNMVKTTGCGKIPTLLRPFENDVSSGLKNHRGL
jgi:hypothetical protein